MSIHSCSFQASTQRQTARLESEVESLSIRLATAERNIDFLFHRTRNSSARTEAVRLRESVPPDSIDDMSPQVFEATPNLIDLSDDETALSVGVQDLVEDKIEGKVAGKAGEVSVNEDDPGQEADAQVHSSSTSSRSAEELYTPADDFLSDRIAAASRDEENFVYTSRMLASEHNRLAGAACFIEDMTDEEKTQHWLQLQKQSSKGRPAREWEHYYNVVIRPSYADQATSKPPQKTGYSMDAANQPVQQGLQNSRWATEDESANRVAQERPGVQDAQKPTQGMGDGRGQGPPKGLSPSGADNRRQKLWLSKKTTEDLNPSSQGGQSKLGGSLKSSTQSHTRSQRRKGGSGQSEKSGRKPKQATSSKTPISAPLRGPNNETIWAWKEDENTPLTHGEIPPEYQKQTATKRARERRRANKHAAEESASTIVDDLDTADVSSCFTVIISNVPPTVDLKTILGQAFGGPVRSARMVGTQGMKTVPPISTNCAEVIFVHAQDAIDYVRWRRSVPLMFGTERTRVDLVTTPNWDSEAILRGSFHNGAPATRVLFLSDRSLQYMPEIVTRDILAFQAKNAPQRRVDYPLKQGRDSDDNLFFEFASIATAKAAYHCIKDRRSSFGHTVIGFLPDPCAKIPRGMQKGPDEDPLIDLN